MLDLFDKTEFTYDDIEKLIEVGYEESIHLDFKDARALDKSEKKKDEIAKDVSSFANSDGGIIIYGVNELDHKANSISFVDGVEYTKEWLENVINSRIQRRIPGVIIYPIRKDGDLKQTIYLVHVPNSDDKPHLTSSKHYYRRYNFSAVLMEEYEIRDAFYRKRSSKLAFNRITCVKNVNGRETEYSFITTIANDSKVVEDTYKVNVYFETTILAHIHVSWEKETNRIDYRQMTESRFKVSATGMMPIFPDETMDVRRWTMRMPTCMTHEFENNTSIEVIVYFPNGEEVFTTTMNEFLTKARGDMLSR